MAIASAAASRKRGSQEESDHYFEMAIRSLDNYALSFHLQWVVTSRLEEIKGCIADPWTLIARWLVPSWRMQGRWICRI